MICVMSDEFAKKLRDCFDSSNISISGGQTRLAIHLGIKPQAVQQWLSGKT